MFSYFRAPVSWSEIVKRTVVEARSDGCMGLAAQLAFYFFLALFPALIFLIALVGFIPVGPAIDGALAGLERFAPADVVSIVERQLAAGTAHGGLLTFGILGAVWSSSTAMTAIIAALNRAYDIEEWRSWWKMRVIAILLTLGLAGFTLLSLGLVMVGPALAHVLVGWLGVGAELMAAWQIAQWPIAFLLVIVAMDLIYHFAPNADTEWVWLTPGSLVATTLWLATSLGFKLYISRVASFQDMYGTIGSVIVLLLWFYVTGLVILIGAEMNAVIDKALPHSAAAAKPPPGQRKKIGLAAERAHHNARDPV